LALDNVRLQSLLHARVQELRQSRTRVVTAADEARQHLERDLHDGAQQRLLALLFELRRASAQARSDHDLARSTEIEQVEKMTEIVVEEVRQLANGLYPAVLDHAGLMAAIRDLAQGATVPVELHGSPTAASRPSERTAYLVVCEGVARAEAAEEPVAVDLRSAPHSLLVRVTPFRATRPPPELVDRILALGGLITVAHERLTAEVPCE
jgi:signal transduction histidine kinase